jgi:uncharacterized protein YndB with AHSA1/START domain
MKNDTVIIGRVSITINVPVSKVWEALTKPEIIKQYFYGTDTVTDWKAGSPIIFKGEWQGKKYQDKGTILNFEPNTQIKYSYWSSMSGTEDKPENYANVTYDVSENGDGTMVTITQDNIPNEKSKEHSEQNWGKVLADLKTLLEK